MNRGGGGGRGASEREKEHRQRPSPLGFLRIKQREGAPSERFFFPSFFSFTVPVKLVSLSLFSRREAGGELSFLPSLSFSHAPEHEQHVGALASQRETKRVFARAETGAKEKRKRNQSIEKTWPAQRRRHWHRRRRPPRRPSRPRRPSAPSSSPRARSSASAASTRRPSGLRSS